MPRNHGGPAGGEDVAWVRSLGVQRLARDTASARAEQSQNEREAMAHAASAARWPSIVSQVRHLVDAYNAGAGRVILFVAEEPEQTRVTVAAVGDVASSLTAELEGDIVSIQVCAAGRSRTSHIRLRADRDDQRTAAYALQEWMQSL